MTKHTQARYVVNSIKEHCTDELKATNNDCSQWLARVDAYKKASPHIKSCARALVSGKRVKPVFSDEKTFVKLVV